MTSMTRERTRVAVTVIACVDQAANRWQIAYFGSNRRETVSGDKLIRLRPPFTL
jgi:hypothetical protein